LFVVGDRFSQKSSLLFFSVIFLLGIAVSSSVGAATCVEFIGDSIPTYYSVEAEGIFFNSDSLYLNNSLLLSDIDYNYDTRYNRFDLSRIVAETNDTLRICYSPLPSWVNRSYGRHLPSVTPSFKSFQLSSFDKSKSYLRTQSSDIKISGAESFRFSARSSGGSNFSQSLDLALSGELTPGVKVIGAVSDRGYNPVYGTANSQLKELDRIHLEILSQRFTGRIGDLALRDRFSFATQRDKRLSGVTLSYHDCHQSVQAIAARPKGHFQTVKFSGSDQLQGPYQIDPAAVAVVPGSEQVWLDGQLLERGTHKDYVVYYPVGQITFNINRPIDSRSRIEIDYEPQTSNYRGELFAVGGGVSFGDSIVTLETEWLREGDDKSQPMSGELSDSDKLLLESVGDNVDDAWVSGVRPDSTGRYILVRDSLPDTVYQYVESDTGDYAITFSFVGANLGEYLYTGNGVYRYAGHGNGEFLPIRTIALPQRTEHYLTRLGVRNNLLGTVTAEWHQSWKDRNLFSSLDDNDNNGALYAASLRKSWGVPDKGQYLLYQTRFKEVRYQSPQRIDRADFAREYFLPEGFFPVSDERRHLIEGCISPFSFVTFTPTFARLNYHGELTSRRGGGTLEIMSHRSISGNLDLHMIRVNDTRHTYEAKGKADLFHGGIRWNTPIGWDFSTNYEYDSRTHDYTGEKLGTRYHRLILSLNRPTERIDIERYVEDTLINGWTDLLRRTRLTIESHRRHSKFSYATVLTYQWLKASPLVDNNYLGRLNLEYHDKPGRFKVRASYLISEEARRARGISYLLVEQGEGQYVFEDGEYRPESGGDYVKVEEILSTQARVSRGEKTFHISRDWSVLLIRYDSRIKEEMMQTGRRSAWWAVPFISDERQPYLYYNRHNSVDFRLFPVNNIYAITISLSEDREIRDVGNMPEGRRDQHGSMSLRQITGSIRFEETMKMFATQRDAYYSGTGDIDGYSVGFTVRQLIGLHELSAGAAFRRANSTNNEQSELYRLLAGSRLGIVGNGELRFSVEFYRQTLYRITDMPSYLLTDNRPGYKGAVWSISVRYGAKSRLRFNLSISGRHADTRTASITGHGEMVAGF